ncbi:MAG: Nif3-like dinuclear metal center hexameric protein [Arthrobacter sp.]|jgi:dinuclear metal center YbgI/SA1388 family protein|nr:Nif3-like dinuclear metal center hexameric protein [Arthrobacter sp.]
MKPVNPDVSADTATGDDTAFDTAFDAATDAVAGAATGTADGAASGTEERSDSATLGMILLAAEELWPASLAEEWDEVGLVAGHPSAAVTKILFAVDPTIEVIEEAIEWGAELVIAHHPLLLKGVTSVAANTAKGKAVHRLIESGTALLTVHTNGDSAVGGVSDVLADALGLQDVAPLTPAADGLPEEGIGRVGDLADVLTLGDFAARVFGILPSVAGGVRVAGDRDGLVRRVAVCGGAGDSLFAEVRASNADVYLTADLRHHPASEAREAAVNDRPYLIDVSHFASEWLWLPAAAEALGNVLSDQGHEVEIRVSTTNSDPWDFILTPGGD